MTPQPILTTERLELRPFAPSDAKALCLLVSEPQVARLLADVPSPLTTSDALAWMDALPDAWNARVAVTFAVATRAKGELIGSVQ